MIRQQITKYICSHCGRAFNTEEECLKHERGALFEVYVKWIPNRNQVYISNLEIDWPKEEDLALGEMKFRHRVSCGSDVYMWYTHAMAERLDEATRRLQQDVVSLLRSGSDSIRDCSPTIKEVGDDQG